MDKIKILILVDIIAIIAFSISLFSGIVLWLILPAGSGFRGGRNLHGTDFLGLSRHDWIDIHTFSSIFLSAVIIYHLVLHWEWIKRIPKMISKRLNE